MTKLQRLILANRNRKRLAAFERIYTRQVYKVLKAVMDHYAAMLREHGVEYTRNHLDHLLTIEGLQTIIESLYKTVGLYYIKFTNKQLVVKSEKGFGKDLIWIKKILDYLRLRILVKVIRPIAETTIKRILEIMSEGEEKGWGIDKMAFKMESDTLTVARARLITRTEMIQAQWKATQIAREESIWETTGEWVSAHDDRVRDSHLEVDGEVKKEGETFRVARYRGKVLVGYDNMSGPGDPDASIENLANCRCALAVRLARDANGKLIRKSKIYVALPGTFTREREPITI